jgi:rhamnosyltransferase
MLPSPDQVAAVVVAYHPDPILLERLFAAARPQVATIVVVDNTPAASGKAPLRAPAGVHVLPLGANVGLAAGINRGCEFARAQGARFVLLFDQDSEPAEGMTQRLCEAWAAAAAQGRRLAAAGPRFEDDRGAHTAPFLRVGFPRNRAVDADGECQVFVDVDMLITSGSLVSAEALDDVGGMDESLFIDNVDIEWCFRAKARGWDLAGAPLATLAHRLGDEHVTAPAWARALGKASAIHHAPVRLYYITRNRIRLYWMAHVPLAWKAQDMLRLPAKIALSLWIAPDRREAAKALARGVVDGFANRGGARP